MKAGDEQGRAPITVAANRLTSWSVMKRDAKEEEETLQKRERQPRRPREGTGRGNTVLVDSVAHGAAATRSTGQGAGSTVEQALIAQSIEREGELKMRVQRLEEELREKERLVEGMRNKMNSMLHIANDCGAQWTGVWLTLKDQEDPKDLSTLLDMQAKNAEAMQIAAEITGAQKDLRKEGEDVERGGEEARKLMFTDSEIRSLCGVPLSGEMYSYVRWSKPGELQVGELVAVRRQNSLVVFGIVFAIVDGVEDKVDVTIQCASRYAKGRLRKILSHNKIGKFAPAAFPHNYHEARYKEYISTKNEVASVAQEQRLKRTLSQYPRDLRSWCELGRLYHSRKELELARDAYEKALKEDPFDYVTLTSYGRLKLEEGDKTFATWLFRRAGVQQTMRSNEISLTNELRDKALGVNSLADGSLGLD
ncbi:hypothetical protein GUITHDRAFT_101757 [Guillardia theta CCMP2712]|uniref:Uncharacterized protein n=1 Tax=Guillardia theta (strain CCMP2712) TaxID=905079 RepID=L1JWV6_GUITC|nr:hypothetical protein GUITHDRAFT_101757 [Guillardia theta CCMP2712]EKX52593.1 hypothetical protein GUITHDRAFT_101757 [Guillardia theta CCMP2712]|eukprot:XP_005839573.1 hypothetical protein GUITHDRAFT_101757 [Guillardia theta CCMP2712]